jgi:OOP family OmpA-OmpF porin
MEPGLLRTNLILFETGKTTLLPISRETLLTIAGVLAGFPEARIEVAGYTDSRGSAEMNQELSERRAEAVRAFLVGEGGLDPGRVTARGYGESGPVASNATDTGRALNRRVEFRVLNPEALVR